MPIMMQMEWEGVTPAQYDAVRKHVDWEDNKPAGSMFHVVSFNPSGMRVVDVWESAEHFQRFVEQRLMPGVQAVGVKGEPKTAILPTHRIFAPAYKPL
jgi:hypothetical protein